MCILRERAEQYIEVEEEEVEEKQDRDELEKGGQLHPILYSLPIPESAYVREDITKEHTSVFTLSFKCE